MKSDIEIAQEAKMKPIAEIAASLGIADEDVEHLLQRGVRGDERVQGHGIGLAIVQDIVKAYRGELGVDRSPALGGARFSVRLGVR